MQNLQVYDTENTNFFAMFISVHRFDKDKVRTFWHILDKGTINVIEFQI